ncbi:TPA: hypothetical protein ACU8BH_001127 [Neisseria subflava]
MFSTKYSLQNAWLTVYVYSSQTPLKQVDINLPVESGVIRMTAQAEVDENGEILFDTTRLTDLASSELVRKTGEVIPLSQLENCYYHWAILTAV